ncbi:hypothetical protein GCM10009665_73660 [Kitasatospora nipponensis]|uniref:Membrane protein YfhO n=1 Tax=Kitasatospora nipponensis TaxID=258049 RepID=A0ABP4DQZ5_9ACTN
MRERWAALGAAGLAMGTYGTALAVRGADPFGSRPRAGTQLTEQVVPMHAHLWDLLRGQGGGDLLLNWDSGYGAPFAADLIGSLLNPFSWLVALLPRAAVPYAVLLATLLSIGLAVALMTIFLGRLRPGPPWPRALLATGYGLCAWVLVDAAGQPARLWGPVALPLLCLAFDRCVRLRGWVPGTLAVALAWWGNFPTAATASLGAGLVLVLRLLLDRRAPSVRLRALARAVAMAAVGIGLAAPALWVSFLAGRSAQPAAVLRPGTPAFGDYLSHLLPGALATRTLPDVFVGVLGLLLVAALPFNRAVPAAERIGWCAALLLLAGSFAWRPDFLLWHFSKAPEGDPYRSTFVLSGLLTMAAWVCLSRRPALPALGGGVALLALLAALGSSGPGSGHGPGGPAGWVLLGVGVPLLVVLLELLGRPGRRRQGVALTLLTCAVLAGSLGAALWVPVLRERRPDLAPVPDGAAVRSARQRLRAADDWPLSRTDPGPHVFTGNDPMLLGAQGGGYRSDYLPATTAQTLHALGAGWFLQGRQTLSFADPVGQALFAVTTSLEEDLTLRRAPAAPLVTVHPPTVLDASSVFSRQQALLGARVYEVPVPRPAGGPAPTDHGSSGWSVPATPAGAGGTVFTAGCTPGRAAYFYAPYLAGVLGRPIGDLVVAGRQNATALPIVPLGTVPPDGTVRVEIRAGADTQVPARPFGCLDPAALAGAVDGLRATGALRVRAGGHTISADLHPGSTGTALLALPAVPGWRCALDGGPPLLPQSAQGLLAVPLGAGADRLSCSFTPPGLGDGLRLAGGAAGVLVAVALWRWWPG